MQNVRLGNYRLYGTPWLDPDPQARLLQMSVDEIAFVHEAIPSGVLARHRASPFYPVQVPDLIGVKDRHYLDRTGLQQHRGIVDLMRYAALNQGGDDLASFDGFVPDGPPTSRRCLPRTSWTPSALRRTATTTSNSMPSRSTFIRSSRRPIRTSLTRSPPMAKESSSARVVRRATRRRFTLTTS